MSYNEYNYSIVMRFVMMDYTITIPEMLYTKAQYIAENSSQSVEDVIYNLLKESLDNPRLSLPQDEQDELQALTQLSGAALWTIAREQMPSSQNERLQALMTKNTSGTLTDSEQQELSTLVADGQRLTLRKAEAMKILIAHGHSVTLDDLAQK